MNIINRLLFQRVPIILYAAIMGVALCVFVGTSSFHSQKTEAATSIVVTSPKEGQKFEGNDLRVTGTTAANSTVVISIDGLSIKQLRSDANGSWATDLSNLPNGTHTFSARVIKNEGHAYFFSVTGNPPTSSKINEIHLSDDAINPGVGWPITSENLWITLIPPPTGSRYYAVSPESKSPAQFDASAPTDPVAVIGYPENKSNGLGAFSVDGAKYYSPNQTDGSVEVVDVASNTWSKTISIGATPNTAMRGPNGNIYVATNTNKVVRIDPGTDTVAKSSSAGCAVKFSTIHSLDAKYPYYFVTCPETGTLEKYSTANDELVLSSSIGGKPWLGSMSLDNSQLFTSDSVVSEGADADKIKMISSEDLKLKSTVQLTAGTIGFFPTPDFQKIYIPTPGLFNTNNIDVYDVATGSIKQLSTEDYPLPIVAAGGVAQITNVNVSVVLGIRTSLANTGVKAVSVTMLLGVMIGSSSYIYYDYRRHRKPLALADPNVKYTLIHHVRVVTLPLLKYRVSLAYDRATPNGQSSIHKF